MNLQEGFPETVPVKVAAELMGISPYEVRSKVVSKELSSVSYEDINLDSIGKWLMENKGWEQEYTEMFIHVTLYPVASI
jgi:hypothetical protein